MGTSQSTEHQYFRLFLKFFSFTPILTSLFFGLPAYQATAASKMVKVEEAKPFIPVSLWDHMNPFLLSFHSQVVLQTAPQISIDPMSSGSSGSVRHVSPRPSVTAWPALEMFISFSHPPLTRFCSCSFSFSTSRSPLSLIFSFFELLISWFQDFPSFQSLVGCFILVWTSLHRFSVCLRTLYLMYWFWVSVWRTFVALICIHTALLLQNRAFLLV